jgi:DNA-binding NarL/FixJ family response regulator
LHLDAALSEARGEFAPAVDLYRRAIEEQRGASLVTFVADLDMGLARCHLALDQLDYARAAAASAATRLARWPGWRADEADALLRRLTHRPERSGGDGLTSREREVAALVAVGLSNGEIGTRLYISTKTASVHVSNILAKLGMSSRSEVAAWAVRTGLDGSETASGRAQAAR